MAISRTGARDLLSAVRTLEAAEQRYRQVRTAAEHNLQAARRQPEGEPNPGTTAYEQNKAYYVHQREQRVKAAREKADEQLATVDADVRAARTEAEKLSSSAGPWPNPSDEKIRSAWDRLRGQLDAGVPLPDLIKNADLPEVMALRQELPARARAERAAGQRGRGQKPTGGSPDTARAQDLLEARYADVLTESGAEDDGAAVRAGRRARTLGTASEARADGVRGYLQGDSRRLMSNAMKASFVERTAERAGDGPPDGDDGDT